MKEATKPRTYSRKLTLGQNEALASFEGLTSCAPLGIEDFEAGHITAVNLWHKNFEWLVGVANGAQKIQFPE